MFVLHTHHTINTINQQTIFIRPSEVENLHPLVRRRLDRLLRRIQVITQPLNYCLLWSQHQGSAVSETVFQCKEVLKQTYSWLHDCNQNKSKLQNKEYMIQELDDHIQEIDFCLQSLNLSLAIIQTSTMSIDQQSIILDTNPNHISPSNLLIASNRIQSMHNSGGDVALCFGQLFVKDLIDDQPEWKRMFVRFLCMFLLCLYCIYSYRRSTLKLYRNYERRMYELRIESNEYLFEETMDSLYMKFNLSSAIYFTTLSSLKIDSLFTCNREQDEKYLMKDAFGFVSMIANQLQKQYIFVFKSNLENWNEPLPLTSEEEDDSPSSDINLEKIDEEFDEINANESSIYLTASVVSLDKQVMRTRHKSKTVLAPGGDYDQSHINPQLMAYMIRLAIYENECDCNPINEQNTSINLQFNRSNITSIDNETKSENIEESATVSEVNFNGGEIPAHLSASDEELYLFLCNPLPPPIPFESTCEKRKKKKKIVIENDVNVARIYKRKHAKVNVKLVDNMDEELVDNVNIVSDIQMAANTSLLENVDLTTSQTFSPSAEYERRNANSSVIEDDESRNLSRFAHLSLDDSFVQ